MTTAQRYLLIIGVLICSVFASGIAFALQHHSKHNRAVHFAVLSRHYAHATSVQSGLPATAELARTVGDNNVYVFERVHGLEAEICVADKLPGVLATACGPGSAAEREGIDLLLPNLGTAPTVVVLVPNGVSAVSFTKSNGVIAIGVVNNVAVVEGAITAYHYTTPSGGERAVALEG